MAMDKKSRDSKNNLQNRVLGETFNQNQKHPIVKGFRNTFGIGRITHGHLYTGQLCSHFVFRQVDIMGAVCWDPNYTQGLDFLDHNFLSSKNSG